MPYFKGVNPPQPAKKSVPINTIEDFFGNLSNVNLRSGLGILRVLYYKLIKKSILIGLLFNNLFAHPILAEGSSLLNISIR